MDSLHNDDALQADDLSALAWVQDELRKSLDAAHKALQRALKDQLAVEQSDLDAVDPAVLRTARQQVHQAVGVLELAGLPAGAALLRASEALVQKFVHRPAGLSAEALRDIERASFALLDYIGRKVAGKPVSAVSLFPQYEALVNRVGGSLPRPSDLWAQDWPEMALAEPLSAPQDIAPQRPDAATIDAFERSLLGLMRHQQPQEARTLAGLCAAMARDAEERRAHRESATWMLASGFMEGLADGHIAMGLHAKRVLSSLLSQLRGLVNGNGVPSDRLANELLFFCAQAARTPQAQDSVLGRVRRTFGLERHQPVDLGASSLGRFDPGLVAQAIKRVAGAKEGWSAVAGGDVLRLGGLNEQFSLVADSLRKLFPQGDVLAQALSDAMHQTVSQGQAPQPNLAMEVATSLLYIEACLEDAEFDAPGQTERLPRLAERIVAAGRGELAGPLEAWMEDLYRRVSDRQTIGSVVQELRATLSECEKLIDRFFRDPLDRSPLMAVPAQLQSMRGVLAVLGLDLASQASVRMRDDVDQLLLPDTDLHSAASAGVFDRLASNLGALGFLIDMMGVQPNLARKLFDYNAETGVLSPLMGRERRAVLTPDDAVEAVAQHVQQAEKEEAQAVAEAVVASLADDDADLAQLSDSLQQLVSTPHVQEQGDLASSLVAAQTAVQEALAQHDELSAAAAREQVAQALADLTQPEPAFGDTLPEPAPLPLLAPEPVAVVETTGLEGDDEMRGIFLEEAREVIADAREALAVLQGQPDDIAAFTAVRRAFHTLKGSSRMVGLRAYGDGAWACEQLMNAALASQQPASADLLGFADEAFAHLAAWTEAIASGADAGWHAEPLVAAADSLRLQGRRLPVAAVPAPAEAELELDLDLDLGLPQVEADAVAPTEPAPLAEPAEASVALADIALDLDDLEVIEPAELRSMADEPPTVAADLDAVPEAGLSTIELDLALDPGDTEAPLGDEEPVKVIGDLRIPIPLFNIYLNEADEQSRRLCHALGEWALGPAEQAVNDEAVALAHSLAGNSATVGLSDLSMLARLLEHAMARSQALDAGPGEVGELFNQAAEEVRQALHQFAAGFLRQPSASLMADLDAYDHQASRQIEARSLWPSADLPVTEPDGGHGAAPSDAPGLIGSDDVRGEEGMAADGALQPDPAAMAEAPALSLADLTPPSLPPLDLSAWEDDDDIDAVDQVDADLFPIFEDEAHELLPQLSAETRRWLDQPADRDAADACMRTLHTFKGGARLAGAMRLGEMAHRIESAIERLLPRTDLVAEDVAPMQSRVDRLIDVFEALRQQDAQGQAAQEAAVLARPEGAVEALSHEAVVAVPQAPDLQAHAEQAEESGYPHPAPSDVPSGEHAPQPLDDARDATDAASSDLGAHGLSAGDAVAPAVATAAAPVALAPIDWRGLGAAHREAMRPVVREAQQGPSQAAVRVRPQLLDRLVNHAGEVAITRTRLQGQVGNLRGSLTDLTDNLDRLRQHLRDIELQAETQVATRMEQARAAAQQFDPLEFDRYTRFQELTRMMAESVNDVATVQRSLQRSLETTEDQLATQARLTRDLQDDLLRTRMVEFEGLSERLYRVVRQAAKETGKQVRLDIVGGNTEVDRGVLERMTGAFEHLLRNCVTHGIEAPAEREASGKDATGTITVTLVQEGNEVSIAFADDGAGLQLARIRQRAESLGLVQADAALTDDELAQLIFTPGFSTAEQVTELAGRGVGMDVVRAEVHAMGGRVETRTQGGQGTRFTLVLPLTTAVTRVVMLRCGQVHIAVPTHLIELVRRARPAEVEAAYQQGQMPFGDQSVPFFWLGALLEFSPVGQEGGRSLPVVIIRSAQQRIAVHVDEVLGNQEVVVKNLGPQLARLPGLAGMTLLASGAISLIYNPVALATVYGERAHAATARALSAAAQSQVGWLQPDARPARQEERATDADRPLVLVVDDSLTVRRVTQRLLAREGYRVNVAKDGLDALESLAQERPSVVLSDIEMPRMDGFDLVRNIRADQKLADLPVIMITSRIAQKHRDVATELGVEHYLGKPYREEELLALVARHTARLNATEG